MFKQNEQVIAKLLPFGDEKLKAAQKNSYWRLQLSSLRLPRDLKPQVPNEIVPLTWHHFNSCPKLAAKVSKKHVVNLYLFTSTV